VISGLWEVSSLNWLEICKQLQTCTHWRPFILLKQLCMKKSMGSFILLFSAIVMFSFVTPGCSSKPKDADIKASVESALQADPETAGLRAEVTDGVATITGEVKEASAIAEATTIASGVKGVKSVNNNVTVPAPPPAPVEITADDPLTVAVRDATKDFPGVTATVTDGVIAVKGELKAADWKRLKIALDGLKPKKVDASGLTISK
jgi:hyperosmotically inducible periplasmic protein